MTGPAPEGCPETPAHARYGYSLAADQASGPEVSILTSFRGTGSALLEIATAIRDQSFQAFEWIIVADSHCLAGNARMLEDLSRNDSRIRVINHDHPDPAAVRLMAVNAARSAYLCEIASGDLMRPTALEQAIWALESRGVEDARRAAASSEWHPRSRRRQTRDARRTRAIRSSR